MSNADMQFKSAWDGCLCQFQEDQTEWLCCFCGNENVTVPAMANFIYDGKATLPNGTAYALTLLAPITCPDCGMSIESIFVGAEGLVPFCKDVIQKRETA